MMGPMTYICSDGGACGPHVEEGLRILCALAEERCVDSVAFYPFKNGVGRRFQGLNLLLPSPSNLSSLRGVHVRKRLKS